MEFSMTAMKQCFVIGPIGPHQSADREHADRLLKLIIRPTFSLHFKDFVVERADQIARPGMIDSQVITHLIESDLVIADITTRNANAFYELGIRHMLQKPVIHMFRRGDHIPADIAPYRAIEFAYASKSEIREAKIALRKSIIEVLKPGFLIDNPVTRSLGFSRMREAIGRERGRVSMMAVNASGSVKRVKERLGHLVSKTVTVPMEAGSFRKYYDPLVEFESKWEELVIAIASFGSDTIIGGSPEAAPPSST
jgi:hypothetical protein